MKIQVKNLSSMSPEKFATGGAAIADQLKNEFAQAHQITPPEVELLKAGDAFSTDPAVHQHLVMNKSDTPGALGYHLVDEHGKPVGYTFVETSIADGEDPIVTWSHEMCEQVKDAYCCLWVQTADGKMRALEVCDAVEADTYPKQVGDETVMVSNFLTPEYFAAVPTGLKTDYLDKLKGAVAPARTPGGYDIVIDTNGQPSQEFSDHMAKLAATHPYKAAAKANPFSRTSRRIAAAANFKAA